MTSFQKAIKYCAIAFSVFLIVSIVGGIVGALGGISFLFGDNTTVGEMQSYTVSESVTELEVDIAAAELQITSANSFGIESNLKNLKVSENNGKLTLTEKSKLFNFSSGKAVLKITVPADFAFDTAKIVTGAGKVSIERLAADTLRLELGAGEVTIGELTATKRAEIDGGAGKISVSGGALTNLDLDMGVGEVNLTSRLSGSCDLDHGVGAANVTLLGSKDDYTIDLDKGVGEATVDGASLGDGSVYGSGETKIDIDGGVGAIKIVFK